LLVVAICAHLFLACSARQGVQTEVVDQPRAANAPYAMAPDDLIEVVVWKQPDISGRLVIAQDGTINVPLAGRVHAAGMTTDQLQQELTRRLSAFIDAPTVTVRVADARSQAVYIIGEVKKPGVFRLHPGEVLSQALAEAQGFTEFAELGSIRIARRTATQTVQITVNYNLVQSGSDLSADVPLMAGDVVHVP
jgi:polysaccharide biosynthesis/export protein